MKGCIIKNAYAYVMISGIILSFFITVFSSLSICYYKNETNHIRDSHKLSNIILFDILTTVLYFHLLNYFLWDVKLLRNNIE